MREVWKGFSPRTGPAQMEARVHMDASDADRVIGQALYRFGVGQIRPAEQPILLCVGTDRSIGDAFGPLVGSILAEQPPAGFQVMGTLEEPVHATNLEESLAALQAAGRRPFVIAVDACLGRVESIGWLTVGRGSLRPGAGVNKSLPAIGEVYLTGVVNVGGFMEYFVLQNTRLSLVMRMARVAARGITRGMDALLQGSREGCSSSER